ncbi:hypothetical protein B0J13DRAFT_519538 [Dactylonectria estremocensis]|uniref:Uncharacterized protein n=1 Tax=Dactylonectria estremocensis TaxID=1079267 RepID=A0A9P9FE10_9HYPO|nr:hypothetical protein B0J13DRAFT_519538 [Dactylonectria estremocensis]
MATIAPSCPSPLPVNDTDSGPDSQRPKQPSALYSMVMTPVNLIVFLVSLALVDLRYTLARSSNYQDGAGDTTSRLLPSWFSRWLPPWLSQRLGRLVWSFRGQPYPHDARNARDASGRRWYYHTKQKKLIKMEADEAFQLRGPVLAALGVLAAAVTMLFYCVARRAYQALLVALIDPALS